MKCAGISNKLGLLTKFENQAERKLLNEDAKNTQDLAQILAQ